MSAIGPSLEVTLYVHQYMKHDRTDDLSQLRAELDRMNSGQPPKEGCAMCRMVLIASAVMFFAVLWFVFVVRVPSVHRDLNEPLSPEKAPPITSETYIQEINDLASTLHPEDHPVYRSDGSASATPNNNSQIP